MYGIMFVALGGAIGAAFRHIVGIIAKQIFGTGFPYGTLTVNILGSFVMGVFIGWMGQRLLGNETLRLFFAVGILGGFTTFSSFSLDAIVMLERKTYGLFALYVGSSVILSLAGLVFGLVLMRDKGFL